LHFFHATSSEPRRAPELAELQRVLELAVASSELRIGLELATASSELRKAPELALQGLVLAQVFFSSLDLGLNWFLNYGKSVYSQVLGVFGNSGHVVLQRGISDNYSDPIPCFCRSHLSSNLFFLYIFGMGLQSQLLYPKYLLCFV
jgi:hypothetical protein